MLLLLMLLLLMLLLLSSASAHGIFALESDISPRRLDRSSRSSNGGIIAGDNNTCSQPPSWLPVRRRRDAATRIAKMAMEVELKLKIKMHENVKERKYAKKRDI